ncbi:hypothetical protein [Methanorbis rubei]|uniref:Uncharacterized protein n=1 Tax=Methanorbis rubei TaxID=3028300 RepID=A0AAE4SCH0_9EURY|nr:hypothetical protein [Methanocorpusculaceae archaeon Cs1]
MNDKPLSNLALRICQALTARSELTEDSITSRTIEETDTRIDIITCLDGLESCGIIQCKLDEEEEYVYSLSPVWKDHLTKQCSCGGCHHE